jgi:hypothetical protein
MKTSKTIILAATFFLAVASPWVAGTSLAGGKSTNTPPPAQVKKTYNSGQSTTGYTQAAPLSGYSKSCTGGVCGAAPPGGHSGGSGLQQYPK